MNAPADMTLGDLFRALRGARWFMAGGGVIGAVFAVVFLALAVPHYRTTMLVAPTEGAPKADVKALLPDNPSFALQYLVNTIGARDSTDFMVFETLLRGVRVAETLAQDKALIDGLENPGRFTIWPHRRADSAPALAEQLQRRIIIAPVGNTPLRRVMVDHPSPEFARALLLRLYRATDRLVRQDALATARGRQAYLQDTLSRTDNPDHRHALTALLMEQEHIMMLLAIDEPFAALVAEPPTASIRPYWPRRPVVAVVFVLGGMALGFAVYGMTRR